MGRWAILFGLGFSLAGCGLQTGGVVAGDGDAGRDGHGDVEPDVAPDGPPDGPVDAPSDAPDLGDDSDDAGPDGPADTPEPDDAGPDRPADVPEPDDAPTDGPLDEGSADVWPDGWLPGWERRVALVLDAADIDEALADFPVLVHLGASVGRGPDDVGFVFDELPAATDRRKLAVTIDDGLSPCAVEVERWDAVAREAWLWVRVPAVAADVDTVLYLYFDGTHPDNDDDVGDPGMPAAQRVWTNGYRLVFHMQDDPDDAHVRDSSQHGNAGTRGAPGNPHQVAEGRCGAALRWDGVGAEEFIRVEDAASLDLGSSFTAELWAAYEKGRTPDDFERMLTKKAEWNDGNGWEFSLETGHNRDLTARGSSGAGTAGIDNIVGSWAAGNWHHVTVTYNGARARGVVDGSLADDVVIATVVNNNRPLFVGRYGGSLIHRWFGLLDEIRLSDTVRSDAWIRAGYESGRDDLIDFGVEETRH